MLPVSDVYLELVDALNTHDMALLQAPPGAGKSTWLPLQLMRDGHFKRIVMLEPRRLAARNIANYLAQCQNEPLGQSIGLRIRQEKFISPHTKLEIVTEGMLTRMLQADPELTGVDCLIFDEFHERSIAADTALAFAVETQAALRDDLTILLMSATLNSERIQTRFDCPVIRSEGRSYPIDEQYIPLREERRWLEEIPAIIKKAMIEQAGSCLVFLPGQREIQYVAQQLIGLDKRIKVCPLYGDQTKEHQQRAIAPAKSGERKVVLATNVAETSLTIEGIRIVVDSGKRRSAIFNLNTGVTELKTVNISQASAIQRAGRAGRIEPGVVYRLGSKDSFKRRERHDVPEVLCSDISALMLEAKYWGTDINELELLDPPTLPQQQQAHELLRMLEAVDDQHKITGLGKTMLELGTEIRWAHMLLKAKALEQELPGIEQLSIYLLVLLETRIARHAELSSALQIQCSAPHPLFTKQLNFWQRRLKPTSSLKPEISFLPLLVAMAYPDRLAMKRGEGYLLANGTGIDSREGHWVNDEFIAVAELGGKNGTHIFSATAIDLHQIEEYLPHLLRVKKVCEFSEKDGRFSYEEREMLGSLVVTRKPVNVPIDESVKTSAWLDLIRRKGLGLFRCYSNNLAERDKNDFIQLLIRMSLAHQYFPDEFPLINESYLIDSLEGWLAPYLTGVNTLEQLKKVDLIDPLKNCFDWNQQRSLDALLPRRIKVPSGSNIAISYQIEGPAKLSVRMQEVYGLSQTPTLCRGRVSLLMDLLSPAHRSLQLTQDLESFWEGSYFDIQKEMKGRYPKHFWPDHPGSAQATSKTKKKM